MITMSNTFLVSSTTFRQLWLLGSAVMEKVWCTLSLRLSNTSRIQWWVCTMSRGMKRSYASVWSCQKRLSVTLVPFRIELQVLHNALSLPSMSIADIPTSVLAKWDTGLPLMIVLTVLGLALVFSYLLCPRTVRYHYLSQEPARLPWRLHLNSGATVGTHYSPANTHPSYTGTQPSNQQSYTGTQQPIGHASYYQQSCSGTPQLGVGTWQSDASNYASSE